MWRPLVSVITTINFHHQVWYHVLSVYPKFGQHPHPLGYLCAKFCFFRGLHCWAIPWRKITYSINQSPSLLDAPGTEALALRKKQNSLKKRPSYSQEQSGAIFHGSRCIQMPVNNVPESSWGLFLYSRYLSVQSVCNTKYVSDFSRNHTGKPPSTNTGLSTEWLAISSDWTGLCELTIYVCSVDVSRSSVYKTIQQIGYTVKHTDCTIPNYHRFLPECDYVMFRSLLSQIRLSVVCNTCAPYSGGWSFRQYFFTAVYAGHPLTSVRSFTEIVPGEPLRQGH